MTAFATIALAVLSASPDPEVFRRLEQKVQELEKAREEAKRKADEAAAKAEKARTEAIEAYESAYVAFQEADQAYRKASPPERPAALQQVKAASEVFVERALEAYVRVGKKAARQTIRKRLFVTAAYGESWKSVLDALEAKIRDGTQNPVELTAMLNEANEQLALARLMSRPENQETVKQILTKAKELYPEPANKPGAAAPIPERFDFGGSFDLLRGLKEAAFHYVADEVKRQIGRSDPEVRFVRDRLAIVYLVRGQPSRHFVDGFKQTFTSWLREASPDHAVKELEFSAWTAGQRDTFMEKAARILVAEDPSKQMPRCPSLSKNSSPAEQGDAVLCPPAYAGVVAVELDPDAAGGRDVTASWRVREEGTSLSKGDGFAVSPIELPAPLARADRQLAAEGRLAGEDFAMSVFINGTIFKQIRGIFQKMFAADPAALARYRDALTPKVDRAKSEVAPPRESPPKPPVEEISKASTGAQPGSLGQAPPLESQGVAWHAALFAGAPYLEDRSATWLSKAVFSGVDLAAMGTAVTLFGLSIDKRNDYSNLGDTDALNDANDLRKAAIGTLIGLGAFRAGVAFCYWADWCRSWSRAW